MSVVISVEQVSKLYRLGAIGAGTLRGDFERWWARMRGRPDPLALVDHDGASAGLSNWKFDIRNGEIWALRDVSFEVKEGEVLGIIGRNGAGKSTLLKILSQVTAPTAGCVKIRGRVASLLEVGTGFHPELTGRENIYLNGAILGMKRAEIDRKFDEIVDFSGVEQFIDTPVKRYSSGMYVRLAFAVAAHLEPEILLVDEVLAVGDAAFQKKCLGKMSDVARQGRTILLVSHNMAAVRNLCASSIWIDNGSVRRVGATAEVVHAYLDRSGTMRFTGEMQLQDWPNRYGNGEARILSARLLDEEGAPTNIVRRTRPMAVEFIVQSHCKHALHLSAAVVADSGVRVLHLSHHDTPGLVPGVIHGRYVIRFAVVASPLCAGDYSLVLAIHSEHLTPVDVVTDVLPFAAEDVADSPRPYKTISEHAYCWTPNNWSIAPLAD
ncbi:MAG: ABC transporter ATP-binding protein [Candidatus Binatia bacterium]|jgi:lipopolysaccharide transport system ATP-binding protein